MKCQEKLAKLYKMNVWYVVWITTFIKIYYHENNCTLHDLLASNIHVAYCVYHWWK